MQQLFAARLDELSRRLDAQDRTLRAHQELIDLQTRQIITLLNTLRPLLADLGALQEQVVYLASVLPTLLE